MPSDVDRGVERGLGDRDAHVRLRREMHDRLALRVSRDDRVERLADVVDVQRRGGRHVARACPFERSSTTCTSSPRASSASTTCEPMKPAPPVTRTRIAVIYPEMFITLEGLDGSGKTTQARLLGARLEAEGVEVVLTREPGGTPLGEEIRDLVLHGGDVAPWAEAALYAASRAQHVEQLIRPALARGATVICDRYVDSSVAYQGIARGLGLERVLELNLAAVEGLMPDRTILLEIGADGRRGAHGRRARPDRARGRRLPRPRRRAPTGSSPARSPTGTSCSTGRAPAEDSPRRSHASRWRVA